MGLLERLFARPARQGEPHSRPASQVSLSGSSQHSGSSLAPENATRRELLRLVLRETLSQAGIPPSWIGADLLSATSRGREPGIHVRLLIKHWDPRLMRHGVAFEQAFKTGVLTMDPQAANWLLGISWQFSLADDQICPPLPHPGVWTSGIPDANKPNPVKMDEPVLDPNDLLGGSILISGPAATHASSEARAAAADTNRQAVGRGAPESKTDGRADVKADLERLFAVRDADLQRHLGIDERAHQFAATEPAPLDALNMPARQFAATEPAPLKVLPAETRNTNSEANALLQSFVKTDVFRSAELKKPQ